MATDLLKSRAFVRSERALEGYAWVVMVSLLEFAGAEAGGTPIVLVQQYGLFELGSDKELVDGLGSNEKYEFPGVCWYVYYSDTRLLTPIGLTQRAHRWRPTPGPPPVIPRPESRPAHATSSEDYIANGT